MTTASLKILSENESKFQAKLEKLNKIATKLGVTPITYKKVGTIMVEEKDHEGPTGYVLQFTLYDVTGEAPIVAGWKFAATVQHSHASPIVRKAGEFEIPERYYNVDATLCEHCGVRRQRNDTYVVKNEETGEFKIVGSACLKDFLGHASPAQIAKWMEYVTNLDGLGGSEFNGPAERRWIRATTFAAEVALELRTNKFVSRKMIKEFTVPDGSITTADAALNNMMAKPGSKYKVELTEADREFGQKALDWMKALNAPVHKEFLYSLGILAHAEMLETRDLGYIAAGVFMYQKSIQVKSENTDLNEFYGTVGEKIHIAVKIAHTQLVETMYGASEMFVMKEHKTGQTFIWFGSGEGAKIMREKFQNAPDRKKIVFVIKGTIKKHQERNGVKQTILTRVKNTEISYE